MLACQSLCRPAIILSGRKLQSISVGGQQRRIFSFMGQSPPNPEQLNAASAFIDKTLSSHKLTVFSKSTCPFCDRVKRFLGGLGAKPYAVELNRRDDGSIIQDELARRTGSHTVPSVFIGTEYIGGCDTTVAMQNDGTLVRKLREAGAIDS